MISYVKNILNFNFKTILNIYYLFKIPNEILTSESGPLSAPGHVKETNSWHLLWTTKLQTETEESSIR